MIRICEVAIVVDDDDIAKWAVEEDIEVDELIKEIQDEFEKWIVYGGKRNYDTRMDFYGWVEQCPKCEDSNLRDEFGKGTCKFYTCVGCGFKWSKNYMTKAICDGSHTEI